MKLVIFSLLITLGVCETNQCLQDLTKISNNFLNFTSSDPYSLMASYSGKGLNDLGDYNKCANLDYADYILIRIFPRAPIFIGLCSSKNCTVSDYNIIASILFSNKTFTHYNFIKNPAYIKSTHNYHAKLNLSTVLDNGLEIIYPQSYIQDHFSSLSDGAIAMLVICSILFLIIILGTYLDIMQKSTDQSSIMSSEYSKIEKSAEYDAGRHGKVKKVLLSFSVFSNTKKLFQYNNYEKTGEYGNLEIFNGIRAMSMGWIILGHVFLIKFGNTALVNTYDVNDWYKSSKGAIIYGAFYAVDTFFWLSGFLLTYLFLNEIQLQAKIQWFKLYFSRIYRIVPTYIFCLFLTWAFLKYIGNGPLWFDGDMINDECHDYWWTNLLFLNNFIPDGNGSRCMAWTWYLSNDIQFFLITPVILYIYSKLSKIAGWCIVCILIIIHVVSSAMISDYFNLALVSNKEDSYDKIYIKIYCRIGAYAMGIVFGLLYFSYKHYEKTSRKYDKFADYIVRLLHRRSIRYLCYAIGLFLINFVIFIQRSAYRSAADSLDFEDDWNQEERNAFYSLSRVGFALGLGLILLPVLMGYNKLAYKILAHQVWTPISRLSLSCYCIHYGIIYAILMSQKTGEYLNDTAILYDFIICLITSYIVAYIISMMIEAPARNLEKLFQSKPIQLNLKRPESYDAALITLK